MNKSENIEVIEIIKPKIINVIDFPFSSPKDLFLEDDNILSSFPLLGLDNDLIIKIYKNKFIKSKS